MNTTQRKENTTESGTLSMTCRKWFTRGVACMALLFAARRLISQNAMHLAHAAM
jgi:hypothetical protein